MGKRSNCISMIFNIFVIYFSYNAIIALIEYYHTSTYLSVIITWFANVLSPFAFGALVHLRFNMLEILEIINFVANTLFYLMPVIILLASLFSIIIFLLPNSYDYYLIIGVKLYLGSLALICEGFLIKKIMEELFCPVADVELLYDFDYEKQRTKKLNKNLTKSKTSPHENADNTDIPPAETIITPVNKLSDPNMHQ